MPRAKKSDVSLSVSAISDLDLDSLIQTEAAKVEKIELSKYGFPMPLNGENALAEKFLSILENQDVPFSALGATINKMIAPVVGESKEERTAKITSMVDVIFARIRQGADFIGKKCRGDFRPEGIKSDHLHMWKPVLKPRKAKEATEKSETK